MKFLLILGIPAAIIIILIIIANFFPSFDEKRKGESARAIGIPRIRFNPKWIIILLVLAGVGFLTTKIHFSNSIVYPIAADAQDIWPQIGQTVKVKIYPNCWSGWINLPVDPSGMGSFFVKTPGETEILFWFGERRYIPDKISPQWFRTIPHKNFRLRGAAGEAEITIQ